MKVFFESLLVGDEEQLIILVLILGFSQEDLEGPDQTKEAIIHVWPQEGKESCDNQLLKRASSFVVKLCL